VHFWELGLSTIKGTLGLYLAVGRRKLEPEPGIQLELYCGSNNMTILDVVFELATW
jgi:hypothetical protein